MIVVDKIFLDQIVKLPIELDAYFVFCSVNGLDGPNVEHISDASVY